MRGRRTIALTTVFVLSTAGAACGGGDGPPETDQEIVVDPTPTDPRALYEDFVDCPELPSPTDDPIPEDMVVPEGAVLVGISEVGPVTEARGFIDQTPVDLIETFSGEDTLVYLEDEGFEAEILIDEGTSRTYIKATVRCRTGSGLLMLLSAGDQVGALPVPGQRVPLPSESGG